VDEVAAALLSAIQTDSMEEPAGEAGDKVEQAASELLRLIDTDRLEENTQ
jgi:hypothetical protein